MKIMQTMYGIPGFGDRPQLHAAWREANPVETKIMDAYVYQAALLCGDCAAKVKSGMVHGATLSKDSERWPQGPYSDGGGEADSPQHCDHCQVFLENPLTSDGYEYVREQLEQMDAPGAISPEARRYARELRDFYEIS